MNYYETMCPGITHAVRPGDTLYRLSRLYGVSVEQIMDANPDVNIYDLRVGSAVCIPMSPQPRTDDGKNREEVPAKTSGDGGAGRIRSFGAGADWTTVIPVRVGPGDSLNDILERFHMDFETFASMNPQVMPIALKEGSTVYVRKDRELSAMAPEQ